MIISKVCILETLKKFKRAKALAATLTHIYISTPYT